MPPFLFTTSPLHHFTDPPIRYWSFVLSSLRDDAQIREQPAHHLILVIEVFAGLGARHQVLRPRVLLQVLFPFRGLHSLRERLVPERDLRRGEALGSDETAP